MRIKYSWVCCFFAVILAFQTAFGQNEINDKTAQDISVQPADQRIENLMKQARELFNAYDKADVDKFVELSHPNIYKKSGVADFYGEVEFIINSRIASGEELLPSTIESPNVLFEADKRVFGVLTYKLNSVSKYKKDKLAGMGSMVGISEDGGKTWKFVKGVAFYDSFPDAAGMVPIPYPTEKLVVNGIEQ
ncbi:MAG TPA: hypothetical protein VGC97_02115 [Pyrinomonadaceae bacterium]|jgi:hypothetical protein